MDAADDDLGFEQAATLRDGRTVAIRLMRPDDKPRLVEAFPSSTGSRSTPASSATARNCRKARWSASTASTWCAWPRWW